MESFPQENRFGSETSEYLLRKNMPLEYKWKGTPRKYRGGGEIEKDCLEPVPYSTVFKPAGSEAGIINEEQIIGPLPLRKKLTHIV